MGSSRYADGEHSLFNNEEFFKGFITHYDEVRDDTSRGTVLIDILLPKVGDRFKDHIHQTLPDMKNISAIRAISAIFTKKGHDSQVVEMELAKRAAK